MPSPHGRPLFVVGASRSGTTAMLWAINLHPRMHLVGETHYFDDLRVALGAQATSPLGQGERRRVEDYFLALTHRPYGQGGDPEQGALDRGTLRSLADELGGTADAYFASYCQLDHLYYGRTGPFDRWGEKTPRHVFRIDDMLTAFPDAQVIAMYRDPRAVVASYRDWNQKLHGDEANRARASYDASVTSLLWKATYTAGKRAQERFGDQRVRLQRFEDLVADPRTGMEELCEWLGIGFDPAMLQVPMNNSTIEAFGSSVGLSKAALERWRTKLDDHEVAVVQLWCRRAMTTLGYPRERARLSALAALRTLAALPAALARATWANRRRMGRLPRYVLRRLRLVTGR